MAFQKSFPDRYCRPWLTKRSVLLSWQLVFHLHVELSHFGLVVYFSTELEKLNSVADEKVGRRYHPNYDLYF